MNRSAALRAAFGVTLALLLPALSRGAGSVRVVPEIVAPVCGACALAGTAGSRLDLSGTLRATPTLAPIPALAPFAGATLGAAANAPEAANEPRLIVPGRAEGAPRALIVPAGASVEKAVADLQRQESAAAFEAAHPAPDAALMALFDGSKTEDGDGAFKARELSGLVGREDLYAPLVRGKDVVAAEVAAALPALRASVRKGAWLAPKPTTLDGPCCGDAAPKLAALLRMRGLPAVLVEAEFHYYLVVRMPQGDVVVDPTVRQFFGQEKAPASVPQVFVGGWGDLDNLFSAHARSKTTRYDPRRIYRSEAKSREDLLRATAAAYAAPALASEYAELRDAARAPRRQASRPRDLLVP